MGFGAGGRLQSTLDGLPDTALSRFTLTLAGGPDGLLSNARDLCSGAVARVDAAFAGQNGATSTSSVIPQIAGCKPQVRATLKGLRRHHPVLALRFTAPLGQRLTSVGVSLPRALRVDRKRARKATTVLAGGRKVSKPTLRLAGAAVTAAVPKDGARTVELRAEPRRPARRAAPAGRADGEAHAGDGRRRGRSTEAAPQRARGALGSRGPEHRQEVMNVQTRRQFVVRAGTVAASAILSPSALAAGLGSARPAALARGGRFSEGVMSGEPTPSAITLWTRLADAEGRVSLDLEVATDKNFRHVVAHKRLPTSAAVNHNVKSRITGLKAHEQYYYRFATATKDGPVGRFRTALPADSLQPVRFAFWSCQDYTHGYYNAHEAMAREDLDFVVCLGDYIYDETYHTVKDGTGVRDDKIGRAQQRVGPGRRRLRPRRGDARPTTATSTRCTARTSRCARSRRASRP